MPRLRGLLRILAHVALALATLEGIARLDDRLRDGAPMLGAHGIDSLFESAGSGRVGVPDRRFGKWALNSLGYRGDEPVAGRDVVLVFGASESFGLYESPGREYPAQLQSLLDARRPGTYSVVNAAVPGMRVGHVDLLERAIARVKPRYVVIYAGPASYIGVERGYCTLSSRPQAPRPPAGPVLRLQGKLQTLVKAHVPESVQTWVREVELGRHPAARDPIDAVPASTIRAFGDDVECARQAALRAGATPVVLTHATYFGDALREQDRPQMVAWRKFYPSLSGSGLLDLERRANLELRRIGARPGSVFVDVASRVPPGREHFADFVHFTDAGALIVAQALAASILEEGEGPAVR